MDPKMTAACSMGFANDETMDGKETEVEMGDDCGKSKLPTVYWDAMKPYHVSLKILGLVYTKSSRFVTASKVYHGLVSLFMWVNVFRCFALYEIGEKFGVELTTKLTVHGMTFLGAVCTSTGTLLSYKYPDIHKQWQEYVRKYREARCHKKSIEPKRVYIGVVSGWCVLMIGVVMYVPALWNVTAHYILKLYVYPLFPLCDPSEHSTLALTLGIAMITISGGLCVFQFGHLLLVTIAITNEFRIFNRDFKATLKEDERQKTYNFSSNLEYWRCRHHELCCLVESIDACFGLNILLLFVTIIPISSLSVYAIIISMGMYHDQESFVGLICILLTFLLVCCCALLSLIYFGARLNSQATKCKSVLYRWNLSEQTWDVARSLQLMTFYNRLREGHIGLTGWRLFYIDKFSAKMVLLMIISYSLILLKFGQTAVRPPFQCPSNEMANTTSMVQTTPAFEIELSVSKLL